MTFFSSLCSVGRGIERAQGALVARPAWRFSFPALGSSSARSVESKAESSDRRRDAGYSPGDPHPFEAITPSATATTDLSPGRRMVLETTATIATSAQGANGNRERPFHLGRGTFRTDGSVTIGATGRITSRFQRTQEASRAGFVELMSK